MPMIRDCLGACVPEAYVGDGVCDSGKRVAKLDCEILSFDHGDCATSVAVGPGPTPAGCST